MPTHCAHLGPCWLFTGRARMKGGYGQIGGRKNGKRWPMYTHRVAWELTFGPIPAGASVLHKCDVPLCCNPSHLFLGTQADNLADAREKGRLDETLPRIRVFTPEERLAIFEMRRYRGICVDLAHRYGVTKTAISLIRKGRFTRRRPNAPVFERVPHVLVPVRGDLQLQAVEALGETGDDRDHLREQLSRPEGV